MNRSDHDLATRLRALPELPPAPDALPRLLRKRRALQNRRLAMAAALALVIALPSLWLRDTGDARPIASDVASPAATDLTASADPIADLRAIDRALQAAYESRASDDEIAHLWAAREALAMNR